MAPLPRTWRGVRWRAAIIFAYRNKTFGYGGQVNGLPNGGRATPYPWTGPPPGGGRVPGRRQPLSAVTRFPERKDGTPGVSPAYWQISAMIEGFLLLVVMECLLDQSVAIRQLR